MFEAISRKKWNGPIGSRGGQNCDKDAEVSKAKL